MMRQKIFIFFPLKKNEMAQGKEWPKVGYLPLSGTNFTQNYSNNLDFGRQYWNRHFSFFFYSVQIRNQYFQKSLIIKYQN